MITVEVYELLQWWFFEEFLNLISIFWVLFQNMRNVGFRSRVEISEKLTSTEIAICNENFDPATLKRVIHPDRMYSPAFFCKSSLQKRENPTSSNESNSSCSTQSSSSSSSSDCCDSVCRGILRRTWKNDVPHFVFSVNNQTEEYAAHLCMADDDDLDCAYFFHSRKGGEVDDGDAELVGKMTVSTSFSISPNKSRIKETEFLMFGFGENCPMEIQNSSRTGLMRKTGFWKKMDDMFRKNQSSRQRLLPDLLAIAEARPDCELSAIVVKDFLLDDLSTSPKGWGLKFLRNLKFRQKIGSNEEGITGMAVGDQIADDRCSKQGGWGLRFLDKIETSLQSEFWGPKRSYKRLEVILPAGIHGGNGGGNGDHSSLIERWRSDGGCDCGGWDLGCPITVLKTRDLNGEFNSFDLHLQGCARDSSPALTMVEVGDGSYSMFSPSNLMSPLQCFSVGVAAIFSLIPRSSQPL